MERLASQGEHGQAGVPLSARQQPDVLPNVGVQPAALAGGLDVAARGPGSWGASGAVQPVKNAIVESGPPRRGVPSQRIGIERLDATLRLAWEHSPRLEKETLLSIAERSFPLLNLAERLCQPRS